MKFSTDIEGLRQSCSQMRVQLEDIYQVKKSLEAVCREVGGASNFNPDELFQVTRRLNEQAQSLEQYIKVNEYWANSLETAMLISTISIPHFLDPMLHNPDQGKYAVHALECIDIFNSAANHPGEDMQDSRAALEAAAQWFAGIDSRVHWGAAMANGSVPIIDLIFAAANAFNTALKDSESTVQKFFRLLDNTEDTISKNLWEAVTTTAENAENVAKTLISDAGNILNTTIGWLQEGYNVAQQTANTVVDIGGKVVQVVGQIISGIFQTGEQILSNLFSTLVDSFQHAINGATQMIIGVAGFVGSEVNNVIKTVGEVVQDVNAGVNQLVDFVGNAAQAGWNTAVNFANTALNFGSNLLQDAGNWFSNAWNSFTSTVDKIFQELADGFKAALDAALHAVISGIEQLGTILLDPYIQQIGKQYQDELASMPKPPQWAENFTEYHLDASVVIPTPFDCGIELGGDATVKITEKYDPASGHYVEVLTITGKVKGGLSTEPGMPHLAVNAEGEVTIQMQFDETNTEDMGKMALLLQTMGLRNGKAGEIIGAFGPQGRVLATGAEVALFHDNITKCDGLVGDNVEAEAGVPGLLSISGSAEIMAGMGVAKDEKDQKMYRNLNIKTSLEVSGGVGPTEIGVSGETEANILLNDDGSLHKSTVEDTISVSSNFDFTAMVKTLTEQGLSEEVAQQAAKDVIDEAAKTPEVSVSQKFTHQIHIEYEADDLSGVSGNAIDVMRYTRQHGHIKISDTLETSDSIDVDGGGAYKGSASIGQGSTVTVYPPPNQASTNLSSANSNPSLPAGVAISTPRNVTQPANIG